MEDVKDEGKEVGGRRGSIEKELGKTDECQLERKQDEKREEVKMSCLTNGNRRHTLSASATHTHTHKQK